MTLRSQDRLDILHEAKQDALRHADVWLGIAGYLEREIDKEMDNDTVRPLTDANGIQFSYTSEAGEGDDLPRSGTSGDDPFRYPHSAVYSSVRTGGAPE